MTNINQMEDLYIPEPCPKCGSKKFILKLVGFVCGEITDNDSIVITSVHNEEYITEMICYNCKTLVKKWNIEVPDNYEEIE